jgi:carnitine-CoA ligase
MSTVLPLREIGLRTVPDLLDRSRSFGIDRPFFYDLVTDRLYSYRDCLERIAGMANELARRFAPGSAVATLITNRFECVILRYALSCAGLLEVAINGEHKGAVLRGMLDIADAVAIVCEERFEAEARSCGATIGRSVWIDEAELDALCNLRTAWEDRPHVAIGPATPCRVVFTSGTTGVSKGAELSHAYEVITGYGYASRVELQPDDRWLFVTPFFHIDSVLSLSTVLHGGGVFIMAPRFSASRFWDDAIRTGATVLLYVGTILSILRKHGDPPQAHRIRMAIGVGGTAGLRDWFHGRHGIPLHEAYGLTECAIAAATDVRAPRPGSCGKPFEGYEVAVLGADDCPLGPGKRGEIAIRPGEPYSLFSEYRRNPTGTLEKFANLWFHTGDVGSFDADGHLYFHGRMKDVIRHRDENISADELEAIASEHPGVLTCAAIGVPGELGDEDVLLYVQSRPGVVLKPHDVFGYLAGHVADFMVPSYIRIVERLPLTPTEKVAKSKLSREVKPSDWRRSSALS